MDPDTLIAELMRMGFEVKNCVAAVNAGCDNIETAVEWLVSGGTSAPAAQARPTLRLGGSAQSNPAAASIPALAAINPPKPLDASTEEPSYVAMDVDSTNVTAPVSRLNKGTQEKQEFLKQQQKKMEKELAQKRADEKQHKERLRRQIEEEKQARAAKQRDTSSPTGPASPTPVVVQPATTTPATTAVKPAAASG
eukprot:Colp12_sorted_trinity150504_noHs@12321